LKLEATVNEVNHQHIEVELNQNFENYNLTKKHNNQREKPEQISIMFYLI